MQVFGVIVIGFILFCVYFIFKQIEFVVVSVNLYRKMVRQQDSMVKLLIDIRDNTKNYRLSAIDDNVESVEASDNFSQTYGQLRQPDVKQEAVTSFCYHCGEKLTGNPTQCLKCGKSL